MRNDMASTSNHLNISVERERSKFLFPLKSFADVIKFFRYQLESAKEPDITLTSIVLGYIESTFTSRRTIDNKLSDGDAAQDSLTKFPVITYEFVNGLCKKFQSILSAVDKPKPGRYATRQIIKKVSDVVWNSLIRSSYKDRAHIQNLFSYLSGSKLDSFGVAIAVVAGCQLLGYKDVHLALSEDHSWVVFGKNRIETVEVTWHGKGHEDKRGQDANAGYESRSWLYLAGNPVICDRYMEVAAIVASINPSLSITEDSMEIADLQQRLLWLLYDLDSLIKYPLALVCLSELEEVSPTDGRPSCEELYSEAINSSQKYYKNHHVYPYTYLAGYYYRQLMYREAFATWANAADVIRLYVYTRDDEEIYKEFLEIANEIIPHIMKTESSGHSARSILRDSQCFANILRFYDGICQWEEGSSTPILHIGWARPLVNAMSKFEAEIRAKVVIICAKDENDISAVKKNVHSDMLRHKKSSAKVVNDKSNDEGNNNCIKKEKKEADIEPAKQAPEIPSLAALTAACGEKILNPDFLLQGGGEPFAEQNQNDLEADLKKSFVESNVNQFTNTSDFKDTSSTVMDDSKLIENFTKFDNNSGLNLIANDDKDIFDFKPKRPVITLYSQKMKGLKDILLAEKLNTHAISLQVTAQSQVAAKKIRCEKSIDTQITAQHTANADNTCRPKRSRREL